MMQTSAKLVLPLPDGQAQEFLLSSGNATLGRGSVNDIVLSDAKISRIHARLESTGDETTLLDLGSTNGTYVNGIRINRTSLSPGDTIAIGDTTLRFEVGPSPEGPSLEPSVTIVNSPADVDATLVENALPTTVSDTRQPRLAVCTPAKTWEVALTPDSLAIGRIAGNDIVVDHPSVGCRRRHHPGTLCHRRWFRCPPGPPAPLLALRRQRLQDAPEAGTHEPPVSEVRA